MNLIRKLKRWLARKKDWKGYDYGAAFQRYIDYAQTNNLMKDAKAWVEQMTVKHALTNPRDKQGDHGRGIKVLPLGDYSSLEQTRDRAYCSGSSPPHPSNPREEQRKVPGDLPIDNFMAKPSEAELWGMQQMSVQNQLKRMDQAWDEYRSEKAQQYEET